jgi:hypothetical protein
MATRNKQTRIGQQSRKTEQEQKLPAPPAGLPANYPRQGSTPMHKGVYLSALIYIEGYQPAQEDFAALATSALKKALGACLGDLQDKMTATLKSIDVRNNAEDEEDSGEHKSGAGTNKDEKFQF